MPKIILILTLSLISQLSFASQSSFTIPCLIGNPNNQIFQDHPLISIIKNEEKEPEEDPSNEKDIEESDENTPIIVTSIQGTQFEVTAEELLTLLEMIPEHLVNPSNDDIQLRISRLALRILLHSIRAQAKSIRALIENSSDERLEQLRAEARGHGLELLEDVIKEYAPFLFRPAQSAQSSEMVISKKRNREKTGGSSCIIIDEFKSKKKRICISESPLKPKSKYTVSVTGVVYTIVDSSLDDFDFGRFVWFDMICPYSSVALDATLAQIDALAEDFLVLWEKSLSNNYPFLSFERAILLELTRYVHTVRPILDSLATQRIFKGGSVCRHYSLYTAILFSKVARRIGVSDSWKIRILGSRTYNTQQKELKYISGTAHAWNLVTIRDKDGTRHYLLDAFNFLLVELDLGKIMETGGIESLEVMNFSNGHILISPLVHTEFIYHYIVYTIERIFYKDLQIDSIFNENNREELEQIALRLEQGSLNEDEIKITSYKPLSEDMFKK